MTEGLVIFALALTASVITPGPDTLVIFSKAIARGGWAAAPFTLGVVLGKLVLLSLAAFGFAAVVEALGPFFVVVKLAGAAYLIWMGYGANRERPKRVA